MSEKGKYQWTTCIFNYLGEAGEWTTGYFKTRQEAIDDLMREGASGFIILKVRVIYKILNSSGSLKILQGMP